MRVICSWCRKELPEKFDPREAVELETNGKVLTPISHGICEDCGKKMREDMEKEEKDD